MPPPEASERIPFKPQGVVTLSNNNIKILTRAERGELECPKCETKLHGEPVDLGEEATTMLLCLRCGFREI